MVIEFKLDLTVEEDQILAALLKRDGTGETPEAYCQRLALVFVQGELARQRAVVQRTNLDTVVDVYLDPTTPDKAKLTALDALGLTFDGLVITKKVA